MLTSHLVNSHEQLLFSPLSRIYLFMIWDLFSSLGTSGWSQSFIFLLLLLGWPLRFVGMCLIDCLSSCQPRSQGLVPINGRKTLLNFKPLLTTAESIGSLSPSKQNSILCPLLRLTVAEISSFSSKSSFVFDRLPLFRRNQKIYPFKLKTSASASCQGWGK